MALFVATLGLCAIALPHVLKLERTSPARGIAIWLSVLTLRALAMTLFVLAVVSFVPNTETFQTLTGWCWHAILPLVTAHLGLSGHSLGHAASVIPMLALAASTMSVLWALGRTARGVRRLLSRKTLGEGPLGSLIVGGRGIVIAAAGISQPQIIVSAGALETLDDDELAAGVAHERGHIARRHRYILIYAHVCAALARCVPGTRVASARLSWHVERDADAYAIKRHDRFALASAICKAAQLTGRPGPITALTGQQGVASRLRLLTSDDIRPSKAIDRLAGALTIALVTMSVGLAVAIPSAAAAGYEQLDSPRAASSCPG